MDAYGEVEGVGEVDGPVHWIYRTVSDVKQGGRVVKAQVPKKGIKEMSFLMGPRQQISLL